MRILVVGSGGREHALAWKLSQSPLCEALFALPGNPGIALVATLIPGDIMDFGHVADVCGDNRVDLVVVGPEAPLTAGLADFLSERGFPVFGASKFCAQLEGSKLFAKNLMRELGIPTASFATFSDAARANEYLRDQFRTCRSIVVKASGEALGKGVVIANSLQEAEAAVHAMMVDKVFGDAGNEIVVESKLEGSELSLIAICSGTEYRVLPVAQDFKRALDGDQGPNTGGMGAISPVRSISESETQKLAETFIAPILNHFASANHPYCGALFAGLMTTESGPFCLEYNCRFGDPETQAAMLRIENDFADLLNHAATNQQLPQISVSPLASAVVVIAADGYPGVYAKGLPIPTTNFENTITFHAGTKCTGNAVESSGGRVLNICANGVTVEDACRTVYDAIKGRFGTEWHYRKDIGMAQMLRPPA